MAQTSKKTKKTAIKKKMKMSSSSKKSIKKRDEKLLKKPNDVLPHTVPVKTVIRGKKGYIGPDPKLLLADDDPELMEMGGKETEKNFAIEEEEDQHGLMDSDDDINDLILPDDESIDDTDDLNEDDL